MADKSVFTRLRRLFSTDVVIRNVGGNQIKTIDSGHIQSSGEYETNALVDRFNKVYSSAPTSFLIQPCLIKVASVIGVIGNLTSFFLISLKLF